jgi:hypothetical protein
MNDKATENTKTAQAIKEKTGAILAANKKTREEQAEKHEALAESKPTPTQEENDRAALGEHVTEHESDGSPPDPVVPEVDPRHGETHTRHLDPRKPAPQGGYQTRTAQPAKSE